MVGFGYPSQADKVDQTNSIWEHSVNKDEYCICDECGSKFLKSSSKMMTLCLSVPMFCILSELCLMLSKMGAAYIVIGMESK